MEEFLPYLGEFIGTALLILLGDGVVANVVLKKTKGHNSGWIVITMGWATAVLVPALIFGGGHFTNHFNPALTLALAFTGNISFKFVLGYIAAQMLGAFVGAVGVWVMHKDHFDATINDVGKEDDYVQACDGFCSIATIREMVKQGTDKDEAKKLHAAQLADAQGAMLAVFSTGPAIRKPIRNFVCEIIATFVLLFALTGAGTYVPSGDKGPLYVWFVILTLGISLGGTTGYSLNPARDLAPRIAHAVLPIKGKGKSDWGYAWVPTIGPVIGAILGAVVSCLVFNGFRPLFW